MGRRAGWRKFGIWIVLLLLIVWPIYRIFGYMSQHSESYDASLLLYQVAQFQIELLNSSMAEAAKAKDTKELDSLRVSAYSANYTHERLVLAVGGNELTPLHSIEALVQYVLRLQIAGERVLKPEEKETLAKAAQTFKDIYEGYGKLLTSSGKPVSSQNDKLAKLDGELAESLKKRLLR
ncbi:hypothetical protein FE784_09405 [Paenibacillus hemerocallicola]|uniref:S-adenosylmethionine decarboxylase n=1 Tax=Paenibacillus hemerocallicola TaxID=1172614 RepID=A0A5C4TD90_9BACL|nr:hypothetical protein [Paenibacillus hemerocallicola]TNJ66477.1 hypothetical protein FE784_09405 [Paenibacillus hemerocallicola]